MQLQPPGATPPTGQASRVPAQFGTLTATQALIETDNVFYQPTGGRSQTLSSTGLDFDYWRTGSALTGNLTGDLNFLDYLQGAYGSRLLGRVDGQGALSLWEDRLKWVVQDDYGQSQTDAFTPITPDNLENINVFLTGPDLTLRPGDANIVRVGARYASLSYQTSPYDGWRGLENASIGHDLSRNSNISFNADFMQVKFDQTEINPDFDSNRYYGRYSISGARTTIELEAGIAQDDYAGGWHTTPYLQLQATRRISQVMSLSFSAGRTMTDAGEAFSNLRPGATGGIAVAPVPNTSSPYVDTSAHLGWQYDGPRTHLGATVDWERDTYDNTAAQFDVSRTGVGLSASHDLSSRLTASLSASLYNEQYFDLGFRDSYYTINAGVSCRLARTLALGVIYQRNDRTASANGFAYKENRGMVTLTWAPFTRPGLSSTGESSP